jgi:predicted Zn-dependent protease
MKNIFFLLANLAIFSLWSCDGGVSKYDLGAQTIALQPYEDIDTTYVNIAKAAIEEYYGYDVKILTPIELPKTAEKKTKTTYKYKADKLLIQLNEIFATAPEEVTKIVGMVDDEIYTSQPSQSDYAIIAKSERSGLASVISTHRPKKRVDNADHFKNRLKKIIIKEVGHTIGLPSCSSEDKNNHCVMRDYEGRSRVLDNINISFCDVCAKKLGWDKKVGEKN